MLIAALKLLPFAVATTADAQSNLVIVRVLLGTFRLPDLV